MFQAYKKEFKKNIIGLIIYTACVSVIGLSYVIKLEDITIGMFSPEPPISILSITTMEMYSWYCYFHLLLGLFLASIVSYGKLSKQDDVSTNKLIDISKAKAVTAKLLAIFTQIFLFNIICTFVYAIGFFIAGNDLFVYEFILSHTMMLALQLKVASICFCILTFIRKRNVLIIFVTTFVVPAFNICALRLENMYDYEIVTPFAFANVGRILCDGKIDVLSLIFGIAVMIGCIGVAYKVCLTSSKEV